MPYCISGRYVLSHTGPMGATVVMNMSDNCAAVLSYENMSAYERRRRGKCTLLMIVGRTSADGMEKSQYRAKVFYESQHVSKPLWFRPGLQERAGMYNEYRMQRGSEGRLDQ